MPEPKRLSDAQLLRVYNSARHSELMPEILRRVQEAVLAANGLLSEEETRKLRELIKAES